MPTDNGYATNGVDLLAVRQTKPDGSDIVAQYGNYTAGRGLADLEERPGRC